LWPPVATDGNSAGRPLAIRFHNVAKSAWN
jgi:hypothetical protein